MFLCFCFSVKIPFSFSLKRRNSSVICLYLESRGLFYFRPVSPHRKLPFCFRQVHTGECDGGALQPPPHPLQDGSTSRRVHPSPLVICPLRGHRQTPLNLTLFILFEKRKKTEISHLPIPSTYACNSWALQELRTQSVSPMWVSGTQLFGPSLGCP